MKRKPVPSTAIELAKKANLIDYMLIKHPDKVINRYGIRDKNHDSLVLYPDSYCRYSTGEVQDNIEYLVKYQNYSWRDAVYNLKWFYQEHLDKPQTPAFDKNFQKENGVRKFYRPIETGRTERITDYLHKERGLSLSTIQLLINNKKIYAASAGEFGTDFVCFANEDDRFYSLRNVSDKGTPKLLYAQSPGKCWFFSSLNCKEHKNLWEYYDTLFHTYPPEFPLYVCESPIDAVSLYELTPKPGIYMAMCGLKPSSIENASAFFRSDTDTRRKIILAVDNDEAGRKFTASCKFHDEAIVPVSKDWNIDLLTKRKSRTDSDSS